MVQYGNIAESIKEQEKAEFREDYDPTLPISKMFKRIEDSVKLTDNDKVIWQQE